MTEVFDGEAISWGVWDDLRAPATSIPLHGQSGDPDPDTDGTLLFDNGSVEQIAIVFQMPYSWDRNPIRPHVHWSKTTTGTGGVVWEHRYRWINNNDTVPAWSDWIAATRRSADNSGAANGLMVIDSFPEIDMDGYRGSYVFSCELRRNVDATADNYAADARLWEYDIHYRVCGLGSQDEVPST